jgi:hypothetical protein
MRFRRTTFAFRQTSLENSTVTKVTLGRRSPRYECGHDPAMAKFPGGGGGGRHDHARDAGRSLGHVVVVCVGSAALMACRCVSQCNDTMPALRYFQESVMEFPAT